MSFLKKTFDIAKNVGTVVAVAAEEQANALRKIKEKYADYSDDELIRVLKNDGFLGSSSKERGVAASMLKKKGYTKDDISNL